MPLIPILKIPSYQKLLLSFLSLSLLLGGCHNKKPAVESDWQPLPPSISRPLILIDAGHGGTDPGTRNRKYHLVEKQLALQTAKLVQTKLQKMGYRTLMTRERDEFIALDKRVHIANRNPHSIFISIHFNSAANKQAQGLEVYYYDDPDLPLRHLLSKRLASCLEQSMIKESKLVSRGIKTASFRVIKNTMMPACLVEGGFFSNPIEAKRLSEESYLNSLSDGIAQGVHQFYDKLEKDPSESLRSIALPSRQPPLPLPTKIAPLPSSIGVTPN